MQTSFQLEISQLIEIARQFEYNVQMGLETDDQELKCLPTFIPLRNSLSDQKALALDFGGTKMRAAIISLENNQLNIQEGPVEKDIPMKRGVPLSKDEFLKAQAELIAGLNPPKDIPLGYCFSFPAKSATTGDATLIEWNKGISVYDTKDLPVGQTLVDFLETNYDIKCSGVTVLNDTIASMLAGLAEDPSNVYIGLIVGTGTNMAFIIDSSYVKKLSAYCKWQGDIPINLESGNFKPPHLTRYDDRIDTSSENPGSQRFEKAVSGAYLGRIFKEYFKNSHFDPESGSIGLIDFLETNSNNDYQTIGKQIIKRSANLIAASLAGLINFLIDKEVIHLDKERIPTIHVVAEGGLMWGATRYRYAESVKEVSETIMEKLKGKKVFIDLVKKDHANLIGSAYAALKKNRLHH